LLLALAPVTVVVVWALPVLAPLEGAPRQPRLLLLLLPLQVVVWEWVLVVVVLVPGLLVTP
jgi:hypothetical protein